MAIELSKLWETNNWFIKLEEKSVIKLILSYKNSCSD